MSDDRPPVAVGWTHRERVVRRVEHVRVQAVVVGRHGEEPGVRRCERRHEPCPGSACRPVDSRRPARPLLPANVRRARRRGSAEPSWTIDVGRTDKPAEAPGGQAISVVTSSVGSNSTSDAIRRNCSPGLQGWSSPALFVGPRTPIPRPASDRSEFLVPYSRRAARHSTVASRSRSSGRTGSASPS